MQKPKSDIDPAVPDPMPWSRWRRDVRRFGRALGFKPFGVALIVLIGASMWFSDALTALNVQRKAHDDIVAETARIRALAAMRTRIESGLRSAGTDFDVARQRGFAGANVDEATGAWRGEFQSILQANNIGDATLTPVTRPKNVGGLAVVALNVEFTAVPAQVVALNDAVRHNAKLARIASLELVPAMSTPTPRLHVKMRVESAYFPPKSSGSSTAGHGDASSAFARKVTS